jgi:hypothetical protein
MAASGARLGAAHGGRVPEMSPYRRWRVAVFVVTLLVLVLAVAGMITAAAALW